MKKELIASLLACSLLTTVATYSAQAAAGDLYDAGFNDQKIYKFDPAGNRTVFVSDSTSFTPEWLVFDRSGNLFASNPATQTISKIPHNGSTISDFATGINPMGLALDALGNLFAIDVTTGSIFKYAPDGTRTTFVAPAFHDMVGLAFAPNGDLYVTLRGNGSLGAGSIVKFTPNGTMTTFFPAQPGGLFLPRGLVFDTAGNLFVADAGSGSIFEFSPNATKTTFATGLNSPFGLAFDLNGVLFASEFGGQDIVKFPNGVKTAFANSTAAGGLAFEPGVGFLGNISTRALVQTGDNVLIGGFIINGSAPKQVLVRAIGPSLAAQSVPSPLMDPVLSLHDGTGQIASNDDWQSDPNANSIPTQLRPTDTRESAILITLQPGSYTAIISGKNGTTGVALAEIYDVDTSSASQLANISTRGRVQTGDFVMIGGFVTSGTANSRVLVTAKGPSLAQFGLSNVLADPLLRVFNSNGTVIASNDNWKDSQQSDIQATSHEPSNDLESAALLDLVPGSYTAIVTGKNGGTGLGQVEVFRE